MKSKIHKIKTMQFRKHYVVSSDVHRFTISAVLPNNREVGSFDLNAIVPEYADNMFNHFVTIDMGIRIDEKYQGQGLSRVLFGEACKYIESQKSKLFDPEHLHLYIDADASDGFWDHVGMKASHHGHYDDVKHCSRRSRNLQGYGMEKSITLKRLKQGSTNVNNVVN